MSSLKKVKSRDETVGKGLVSSSSDPTPVQSPSQSNIFEVSDSDIPSFEGDLPIDPTRVMVRPDDVTVTASEKTNKFLVSTFYSFSKWVNLSKCECTHEAFAVKEFSECKDFIRHITSSPVVDMKSEGEEQLKSLALSICEIDESEITVDTDDQSGHLARELQKLYHGIVRVFVSGAKSEDLELKKCVLTHLHVPIDKSVTRNYGEVKSFQMQMDLLTCIDKIEMRQNVSLRFSGFGEDEVPSSLDDIISYEINKVNSRLIILLCWNTQKKIELDITEYEFSIVPRIQGKTSGKGGLFSLCENHCWKRSFQKKLLETQKYLLTPKDRKPEDHRVVTLVVKSRTADGQRDALFKAVGMKEISYNEANYTLDADSNTPQTPTPVKKVFESPKIKLLNCMSIEEMKSEFQPFTEKLSVPERNYVSKFYEQCSQMTEGSTLDEIYFQGKFMERKNRFIRLFGSEMKEEVSNIVHVKLMEMNKSRRFYEKSFHFWTWEDINCFSKLVIGFSKSDVCLKEPIVMFDCINLSEIQTEYSKSTEESDGRGGREFPPYKIFLSELEKKLEEDVKFQIFEEDKEIFNSPVQKKDLLRYLFYPKMVVHCQDNSEPLDDLLEISKIADSVILNKELEKFIRDVVMDSKYVRNRLCRRVFIDNLMLNKSNNLFDKIPTVLPKDVKDTVARISSGIYDAIVLSYREHSDLDLIARKFLGTKKDCSSDEILKMRMKWNFSSINLDETMTNKLAFKLGQITNVLPTEKVPFAFFHQGVSLQGVKLDFYSDDHVRVRDIASPNVRASFDIDVFAVPVREIPLIVQYIFEWNQEKYYDSRRLNCQAFSIQFTSWMYSNFSSMKRKKEDVVDKNGNVIIKKFFSGESWDWMQENKFKKKIIRKIKIDKEFFSAFPNLKNVEGISVGDFYEIHLHDHVFRLMKIFENQELYDKLKREFPEKLFLLKSFCRSFHFEIKSEDSKMQFVDCYFTISKEDQNHNKFGIKIYYS